MSHDAAMILHLPTENPDWENSRGRPPKRNEVRVSDRQFSPKNGQNAQFLISSAAIPGQIRGDSAAMSEEFRSDSGTAWERLGEYLADMTTADHERVAINGTCKALIEAIICTQETAQQLRATIIEAEGSDDGYPTYLAGLESMLSHFNAGANVKVTDLYEQSAVADTAITKRFQRDKIKPFIEQRGILIKKEDNSFRWATLPELQNLQKMYVGAFPMYVGCTFGEPECTFDHANKRKAGAAGKQPAAQTLGQKLGWIRHVQMPRIRPELVIGSGIGLATAWGVLEAWDAVVPMLGTVTVPVPEWLQPVLAVAGHGTWVGVGAGVYGLQWAIRTNIKRLSAAIGHALVITGASLPVLEVCGFNSGELGSYMAGMMLMAGVQPAWIAAGGTLLALGASIRMGDPLTRLAGLFDLIGAGVSSLLPKGRDKPTEQAPAPAVVDSRQENALKAKMQTVLDAYKLGYAQVVEVKTGPVVTTFMLEIPVGHDAKKITAHEENISRAFQCDGQVTVIEHLPGTGYAAIQIPTPKRWSVGLGELMQDAAWQAFDAKLPVLVGVDVFGNTLFQDLKNAPHLLVAGTTGSGKSVFVNAVLMSLMDKLTPATLELLLVDPKRLEFSVYEGSPFLARPVVTELDQARLVLDALVAEMEDRYAKMAALKVDNIDDYNAATDKPLPYKVAVFDEFADLIMQDRAERKGRKGKGDEADFVTEVEERIARLAQKARAAGICLILATQKPTVDVVTGLIKSNIPMRIAFTVAAWQDSMTILDQKGAERLLNDGDGLMVMPRVKHLVRFLGAFISKPEILKTVAAQRRRWPQHSQ